MLFKVCIKNNVCVRPNKVALIYENTKYTYKELYKNIEQYINEYKKQGVSKNDRIVIFGKNSDIFVMQIFACLNIGAIFIPVAENIPVDRLNYILTNSNAKYIFNIRENKLIHNKSYDPQYLNNAVNQKEMGCIIYTSGSTALPKGVLESVESMLFVANKINVALKNTENDIILVGLPFSFDYGLYQIFLSYLVGATVVLLEEFGLVQKLPGYIQKYRVTGLPVVPSVFALLIKSNRMNMTNMKTVRYICSTGDALSVKLVEKFHEEFSNIDVIPMYGLTECKRVFVMPPKRWDKIFSGSCGIPLDNIKTEIIGENGEIVPAGQVGELVIYGKNVMEGYWNNKNETENRFLTRDNQRGVRSGDLFYCDIDGYYYFCSRKECYIKRRGIKISPIEVENYIQKVEGVAQCIVSGCKHDIEGEILIAIVSVVPDSGLTANKLRNYLEALPYEMRPTKVFVTTQDMPLTPNGKYDRAEIVKTFIEKKEGYIFEEGV